MKGGYKKLAILSREVVASLKRCEIGPRLPLIINKKSHTPFQLRPISTSLNDYEL